eukprot:SAG22_NODE_314_length_12607_cov_177.638311_5_plen_293_part_00
MPMPARGYAALGAERTSGEGSSSESLLGAPGCGYGPQQPLPPQPAGWYRWVVALTMAFAGVLVLWTRTAQSVAIIPWVAECGWTDGQKQLQLSAFFYGYVGSMWLGPVLCNYLGGHRAFAGLVFFAIVSQVLGPLAGCDPLLADAVRVLVGIFEGPFYPAVAFLLSRWFTATEYSRAQLLMTVGATVGSLVGFPMSSLMCDRYSWRWAGSSSSSAGSLPPPPPTVAGPSRAAQLPQHLLQLPEGRMRRCPGCELVMSARISSTMPKALEGFWALVCCCAKSQFDCCLFRVRV